MQREARELSAKRPNDGAPQQGSTTIPHQASTHADEQLR
jgi:hypothetical protein